MITVTVGAVGSISLSILVSSVGSGGYLVKGGLEVVGELWASNTSALCRVRIGMLGGIGCSLSFIGRIFRDRDRERDRSFAAKINVP
jgi:hypothetical protein